MPHNKKRRKQNRPKNAPTSSSSSSSSSSRSLFVWAGGLGGLVVILLWTASSMSPPDARRWQQTPSTTTTTTLSEPHASWNVKEKADDSSVHGKDKKDGFSRQLPLKVTAVGPYYKLLETRPHNPNYFTQGLEYNATSDTFLEGTGMYGDSVLVIYNRQRRRATESESIRMQHSLPKEYFGEGLATYQNRSDSNATWIVQLTWREQTGFLYKYPSLRDEDDGNESQELQPLHSFSYQTTTNEGWGIAYCPSRHVFYVSDGSEYIHVWNAATLEPVDRFPVLYQGQDVQSPPKPLRYLNELEYDPTTDTILANVWYQNVVVRIDPTSGHVQSIVDLTALYPNRSPRADSFNGIAYQDAARQILWVTGKYWPEMYKIQLLDLAELDEDEE